jgi:hypothetical protein
MSQYRCRAYRAVGQLIFPNSNPNIIASNIIVPSDYRNGVGIQPEPEHAKIHVIIVASPFVTAVIELIDSIISRPGF